MFWVLRALGLLGSDFRVQGLGEWGAEFVEFSITYKP